jgi:peptide/nickel transport system ATP-binding protein
MQAETARSEAISRPLLAIAGLTAGYNSPSGLHLAVRDVALTIGSGEVAGLVGESGSGKSTLAQLAMGYKAPGLTVVRGTVEFRGKSLLASPASRLREIWGRRIAMVHQNPLSTLTPTLTIGAQIQEVLHTHAAMGRAAARRAALEALKAVSMPHPAGILDRFPHEVSGGQRQRVSIAIALTLEPDLILLDEPTTNLDATTEASILDLLESIRERVQCSMLYISHNLGVIARIANRVAVMYAGEIVETGSTSVLFSSPAHPYTRALLSCIPAPGASKRKMRLSTIPPGLPSGEAGCRFRMRCDLRVARCEIKPEITPISADQTVRCWRSREVIQSGFGSDHPATLLSPNMDLTLRISAVSKTYPQRGFGGGGIRAVRSASLEIPTGAILGLVGESGSGKSTLLRCIAGLESVDGGEMEFLAIDLPGDLRSRDRNTRRSIQMIFQDPESTINPALTVGENLRRHLVAVSNMSRVAARQAVMDALTAVRLEPSYIERLPAELSGGEKQRVAIARAFLSDPRLVLCDEPLSALDVSVQATICQLLLDLQARSKASYLFVSHDLSVVRYMSDFIAVMYLGEIVETGDAGSFDTLPLHPYTEALLSAAPSVDPSNRLRRIRLSGHIDEVDKETVGCVFSARCPRRKGDMCDTVRPATQTVPGRTYRCHHAPDELIAIQRSAFDRVM